MKVRIPAREGDGGIREKKIVMKRNEPIESLMNVFT